MMDFKKTLINLHNEFPEFDLDTLFKILDAIVETSTPTSGIDSHQTNHGDLLKNSQIKIINGIDWKSIGVTVDNPYTGSYIR